MRGKRKSSQDFVKDLDFECKNAVFEYKTAGCRTPLKAISQKKRTISVRFFVLYSRRGENEVRKWATAPNGRSRSER